MSRLVAIERQVWTQVREKVEQRVNRQIADQVRHSTTEQVWRLLGVDVWIAVFDQTREDSNGSKISG